MVRPTRKSDVDARILSIRPEPPPEPSMLERIAIATTKQTAASRYSEPAIRARTFGDLNGL